MKSSCSFLIKRNFLFTRSWPFNCTPASLTVRPGAASGRRSPGPALHASGADAAPGRGRGEERLLGGRGGGWKRDMWGWGQGQGRPWGCRPRHLTRSSAAGEAGPQHAGPRPSAAAPLREGRAAPRPCWGGGAGAWGGAGCSLRQLGRQFQARRISLQVRCLRVTSDLVRLCPLGIK